MKKTLVLTIAALGAVANIAWAGSTLSTSTSPSTSHPPLQCACVMGGPAA
ncbi:hypothetical protein [Pseudorhodoferax sp. Leaf274]|nr:hypothetical protein [Pseudorhodoferax sp. Leaf274]